MKYSPLTFYEPCITIVYTVGRFCAMSKTQRVMDRRDFLTLGITAVPLMCFGCDRSGGRTDEASASGFPNAIEARFYERTGPSDVQCRVCPRECVIGNGKRGVCGTRENRDGVLYSLVYGRVASLNVDPIEKKPFYHFLPGSQAYSISTAGCNMWCKFCQNWQLSQAKPEDLPSTTMSPQDVAREAGRYGARSIAYTYNEPTVFTEFVYDCAAAGRRVGVHSVVVSNGYINAEPLAKLCEVISGYKVDFKAFSQKFYREVTGGERDNVLATIKRLKNAGIWMELVHLTIPTLNDGEDDFRAMGDWLMGEVGPDVPVHFTRFYPMYRLTTLPVTPVSTLERAREILINKGMHYVYVGNVPGHPANSTYCPHCGDEVIKRIGYRVDTLRLKDGACSRCGTKIPGVWS